MTIGVTFLLLLAALMHASWNAFIKGAHDPVAMATMIYGTGSLVMLPVLFWAGPILPAEVWWLLLIHTVLHTIYKLALLAMYQLGELSQTYPVARGVAPLLVTLIAVPAAGEIPATTTLAGIGLVTLGLLSFALERGSLTGAGAKPLFLAFGAGIVLSAYTVVDGLGVRTPGAAIAYTAWIFVLDGAGMFVIARIWRGERIYTALLHCWKTGTACGIISIVNFCIVLWAISFSTMGAVTALRETGVVFAAIIGTLFMGESFGLRRIAAASIIAAGIVFMNWDR